MTCGADDYRDVSFFREGEEGADGGVVGAVDDYVDFCVFGDFVEVRVDRGFACLRVYVYSCGYCCVVVFLCRLSDCCPEPAVRA